MPVRVVHLVAKTHLDLGFTALASEVEQQYLEEFFPRAVAVAAALRERGSAERLVWTTGSWILHRALHQADEARAAAVAEAVRAGDLTWHALPLTTHTELMDAQLFRAGLGISQELDQRFGRTTTAAKMTDVPGHTRAMVPLLAEAGVTFLHLGVNPAWPVPDVPEVFRWRSPEGSEVVVAYAAGGYGGELVVPGCDEALAFLHSGDNLGPPSVDDVLAAHADLRTRYPGAEVRASTLDAFARALTASGAVGDLPVVTSEIGDPWLFGAASDPQKVAAYRELLWTAHTTGTAALLSAAEHQELDRRLLLVAEHTWGLDQKVALPEDRRWDGAGLAAIRSSEGGRRFEASWNEQRGYVDEAVYAFERFRIPHTTFRDGRPDLTRARAAGHRMAATISDRALIGGPTRPDAAGTPLGLGLEPREPGLLPAGGFAREIGVAASTGAVDHLAHRPTGRVLADPSHVLGLVQHQTFDETSYDRFSGQLTPAPEDEWWATWDNTKPGIGACGARASVAVPLVRGIWAALQEGDRWLEVVTRADLPADAADVGAPLRIWTQWLLSDGPEVDVTLWWEDKAATRLPEATWCSFNPIVAEPERWEVDKLGQRISPLDVVRRGGRSLHGVGEGMHYDGPDGRLAIATRDAPLVAPGRPNLLDADPPVPDLAGGWHILLHDNCWGTNFPMWNEGPASFRFTISIA